MVTPRILVAGLGGGGGKTLVSVGLAAAWRRRGLEVVPFKKGPDYIDAAWLSRAAGLPCRNLDLFLMSEEVVRRSFATAAGRGDVAVVEGNRGLFDGADARGTCSSAELAKLLGLPVLLVVDCTKTTRTAAALVLGCQRLDPAVDLAGVVLNRTAGSRHESVVRRAIEDDCGLPVVGALPRLHPPPFPERHLGLVPPQEHEAFARAVDVAGRLAEEHLELDRILDLASGRSEKDTRDDRPLPAPRGSEASPAPATVASPHRSDPPATRNGRPRAAEARASVGAARIGVFRDSAFQFYYPENLEALLREGARLVEVSPLVDGELPPVEALYIGGGFPETLAARLAANTGFRESLRLAVEDGLPVYAECGGAVYLGEKLVMEHGVHAMSAAIPAVFGFRARPDGHGYSVLETVKPNPFYDVGTSLRGHEFHYTYLRSVIAENVTFAFRVRRGHGFGGQRDGLSYRNVLACYTHVHALGTEGWARALVRAARGRQGLGHPGDRAAS